MLNQQIISEGKTKYILRGPEPDTVLLYSKDMLTGGDGTKEEKIQDIGILKSEQAANIFTIFNRAGIPTAFIRTYDERQLVCSDCEMLPLEFVVRRFAYGSYLKRNPSIIYPIRFVYPKIEVFYKYTLLTYPICEIPSVMDENSARKCYMENGIWKNGVCTDPFINTSWDNWGLHFPKAPIIYDKPLHKISPLLTQLELVEIFSTLLTPAFKVLEQAWNKIETVHGSIVLVDCKFEIGRRRTDKCFVIADVIDNDNWRIWPGGLPDQQLDKQCFRDGDSVEKVTNVYELVTGFTNQMVNNE